MFSVFIVIIYLILQVKNFYFYCFFINIYVKLQVVIVSILKNHLFSRYLQKLFRPIYESQITF